MRRRHVQPRRLGVRFVCNHRSRPPCQTPGGVGSPCFTSRNLRTVLSPTTSGRPQERVCFCFRGLPRVTTPKADRTPPIPGERVVWASPLASRLATTTGRIEFDIYGPVLRRRLLPTSSHDDAVTFGYNAQTEQGQGLSPCKFHALTGALARRFNAGYRIFKDRRRVAMLDFLPRDELKRRYATPPCFVLSTRR